MESVLVIFCTVDFVDDNNSQGCSAKEAKMLSVPLNLGDHLHVWGYTNLLRGWMAEIFEVRMSSLPSLYVASVTSSCTCSQYINLQTRGANQLCLPNLVASALAACRKNGELPATDIHMATLQDRCLSASWLPYRTVSNLGDYTGHWGFQGRNKSVGWNSHLPWMALVLGETNAMWQFLKPRSENAFSSSWELVILIDFSLGCWRRNHDIVDNWYQRYTQMICLCFNAWVAY